MVKDAFMPHMQALFQKHDFTLAISVLWNADFISLTQVLTMNILQLNANQSINRQIHPIEINRRPFST